MWVKWLDVAPSLLLFLVAVIVLIALFARDLIRRRKPADLRQVKVTVTGAVDRRMQFAHSMGWQSNVFLLWGDSAEERDVYLIEAVDDTDVGWFTHLAQQWGLKVEEVAA